MFTIRRTLVALLGVSVLCGALIAPNGNLKAEVREELLEVNISGLINGESVGPAFFAVPLQLITGERNVDLVLRATLPLPAEVFPGIPISETDWLRLNMPYLNYKGPTDCFDPDPPMRCDTFTIGLPPDVGISPEGIDEAFAFARDDGGTLEGLSAFDGTNNMVTYQFNARSPVVSSVALEPFTFHSAGLFRFPATKPLEPIKPSGRIVEFEKGRRVSSASFNGLVLLRNRVGRFPNSVRMRTTTKVERNDNQAFDVEIRFNFSRLPRVPRAFSD